MMTSSKSALFSDTKPHYKLLDGLRGVAALMVVWYHIFEGFATNQMDQRFNHGYLAVDFFFILSGFVVAYAYDDRWRGGMKISDFFTRRLIRLQPMVVLAAVAGAISFCIQGCVKLIFIGSILLAYIVMKFYDEPVRKWLSKRRSQMVRV